MVSSKVSQDAVMSKTFYNSLFEVPEGERIKSCIQCASCSGVCPYGYLMPFPPGKMIAYLRADMFNKILNTDTVWLCISCYACTQICPQQIPITAGLMTRTKEELVLAGNIPSELQLAFENSQRYGNVMGQSPRKRAEWIEGIEPKVGFMANKKSTDVLWYVGDYPSYHPRVQATSRSFAKLLNALGINFGILGPEEVSDGDSQRLAGERGLFEMLADKNGKAFAKYQFNEIITTDPHSYNALKNIYPELGISYPVKHYTQFLAERIDQLRSLLKKELKTRVTYHDPCYLGRVNNVFDEPRSLLTSIPGVELVEMAHNHASSLCCGGGGGGMWLDGFQWEKAHARTSEWRVREALQVEADILAVACPYEAPRFEDAAKMNPNAGKFLVKDIVELLAEAM